MEKEYVKSSRVRVRRTSVLFRWVWTVGSPVTFEACGPRSRIGRWASQVARLSPRCSEPTACSCPRPRALAIELCTRPSSSCWCRLGIVSSCRTARMSPKASRSAPRCPRSLDSVAAPPGVVWWSPRAALSWFLKIIFTVLSLLPAYRQQRSTLIYFRRSEKIYVET